MDYSLEERFDAYLDKTLPLQERTDFETALRTDEDLRREFELHRETRELVEMAALKAALGRIQQSAAAEEAAPPVAERQRGRAVPFYRSRWWQAAAAVLLIGAGMAAWLSLRPTAAEKLYAKYYAPDAGLPGLMGGTAEYSLDDAMVDYKSGQYGDAVRKLKALREEGVAGDTAAYYLALAYLADKQYEAATDVLHPLTQTENTFRRKAAWYEALALLRSGSGADAKARLEAIERDTANPKAAAARKLLAEWPE